MTSEKQRPDSEIRIRVFAWLTVGLLSLIAGAMVLMWFLTKDLYDREKAQDPPPPLMIEARMPHEPPAPRLQADPFADLDEFELAEEVRLSSYGWNDGSAENAHIPIDLAMDLLLESGIPKPPAIEPPATAPLEN
jgi:hypothetical protein